MRRPARLTTAVLHVASAAVVCACAQGPAPAGSAPAAVSPAESPAGRWEGEVRAPGSPPDLVTITLDSVSDGWHGALLASDLGSEAVPFVSVRRLGDSIVLYLPAVAHNAVLRGRLRDDGRRLDGVVEGWEGATFSVARAGTQEAASLVAEVARVEASRRVVASMVDTTAVAPHTGPDSARLITSDIRLFWDALDRAPSDSLAAVLQRDYLSRGTVGVRDFIPSRIRSAEDLAAFVRDHRARYDSSRAANLDVAQAEPAIRAAFRRLKAIYPDAVFPDIYFVIGRFNSGGTASRHGLLIGAEMYRDPSGLPAIVAHELIHYQQHYDSPTLLQHAFVEGSADFLGEMISGAQINNTAREYGLAHEHALWQEFKPDFDDRAFFPWMYGKPPDGRPNDLGYFIGYRIAEAYYNRMTDKQQAIRDILTGANGNVKELLAKSGYAP
jgi:predicted Zn-dependent protease DUF2268